MGVFVHLASTYLLTMPNKIGFVPGRNKKRPDFRTFLQFPAKFSHNLHGNGRVSVARFHVLCSAICSSDILTERKSTTTPIASADRCKRRTHFRASCKYLRCEYAERCKQCFEYARTFTGCCCGVFFSAPFAVVVLFTLLIQVASARAMCYFTVHPDARITSSNSEWIDPVVMTPHVDVDCGWFIRNLARLTQASRKETTLDMEI